MLNFLKAFFEALFRSSKSKSKQKLVPVLEFSEAEKSSLLKILMDKFHGAVTYSPHARLKWSRIMPVKVKTPFLGWAYVRGRQRGVKVNKRLTLVESDDDMDFSEVCVLVDSVPAFLLYSGVHGRLLLMYIVPQEELNVIEQLIGRWHNVARLSELETHPKPVQNIILDIAAHIAKAYNAPVLDPREKVLTY